MSLYHAEQGVTTLLYHNTQAVLDAREKHPNVTLANMYKEKNFLIFGDLKTAHDRLNRAVMQAYGFSVKDMTETSCVAALMDLYQKLIRKE